jgi:hypothetical protein
MGSAAAEDRNEEGQSRAGEYTCYRRCKGGVGVNFTEAVP